jgi:hypothetical protein
MGHCIESGYGLVEANNKLVLLDPEATPEIVGVLKNSGTEKGLRLSVERKEKEGKMTTYKVLEVM